MAITVVDMGGILSKMPLRWHKLVQTMVSKLQTSLIGDVDLGKTWGFRIKPAPMEV